MPKKKYIYMPFPILSKSSMFGYAIKEDSIHPCSNKCNKISNNENPICTLRYFINMKVTF